MKGTEYIIVFTPTLSYCKLMFKLRTQGECNENCLSFKIMLVFPYTLPECHIYTGLLKAAVAQEGGAVH